MQKSRHTNIWSKNYGIKRWTRSYPISHICTGFKLQSRHVYISDTPVLGQNKADAWGSNYYDQYIVSATSLMYVN